MTKQRAEARERTQRSQTARQSDNGPTHPVIALQQQIGNARVARLLAPVQREAAEDELMAARDPAVQREAAEDELQAARDPAVQREAAPEEDELARPARDPAVQRSADSDAPEVGREGGPVSAALQGRIQAMRGGGAALDGGVRGQMERSLGAGFGDVRIHTGGEAAAVSRRLGALAFTTGRDIFFGANASPADNRLLAHELTHVVQQRGAATGGPLTVGPADDHAEHEAEATADQVATAGATATNG